MRHSYKRKGKREATEGIEVSNKKSVRELGEKENYKYSEILEVDVIKQTGMKKQTNNKTWEMSTTDKQEMFLKPIFAVERNKYQERVWLVRYSGLFLKWIKFRFLYFSVISIFVGYLMSNSSS